MFIKFVSRLRIHKWQHLSWQEHCLGVLQGVAEIADGVVTLGSLGFYLSNFENSVSYLRAGYSIKRAKRKARNE